MERLRAVIDPELDALLDRYRADPADGPWKEILAYHRDTVPLVPLTYGGAIHVHSWRVRD